MGKAQCAKVIGSLAEIATKEVSKTGLFKLPGVVQIKTRMKPATKAGEREVFGKVVMVKATCEEGGQGISTRRLEEERLRRCRSTSSLCCSMLPICFPWATRGSV